MEKVILVLDIGTTNIKSLCFNKNGDIVAQTKRRPHYILEEPGQVEQDPKEIWDLSKQVLEEIVKTNNLKADNIECLAITTQRASWCFWNRETGELYTNINTWQDKRAGQFAEKVSNSGTFKAVRGIAGLISKFSKNPMWITGSQLRLNSDYASARTGWVLENNPRVRALLNTQPSKLAWGTIDSWVLFNLTGKKVHATDYSNASATGFLDPFKIEWNKIVLKTFKIPTSIFPEIRPTHGDFGTTELFGNGKIAIKAVIADQQSSLFGLFAGSPERGSVKVTNGTGTFVDIFTGDLPFASKRKLYPLIAWGLKGEPENVKINYILEGLSHNCGNLVDFIQESLGFIKNPAETAEMAQSVADSKSTVFFVPSLTSGLSFPWWDATSKAAIFGIDLHTRKEHIVRAVLEGICFRIKDILEGIVADTKIDVKKIKADGGVSQNKFVLQFLADILGIEVEHSGNPETTALGAAFMAGLETGYWKSTEELKSLVKIDQVYSPKITQEERNKKYECWKDIIKRSLNYLNV